MKRRLVKYLLVGSALVVLGLYWAFTFFLFNPFEEPYEYPLATLLPRDVHFYAAKAELGEDFDPFPKPAFADAFLADPHARALLEYEWAQELLADFDFDAWTSQLRTGLAGLPVELDPLELFGGGELAVAGYFTGPEPASWEWAVCGRANWIGKVAVEVVRSMWLDLESQGLSVVEAGDGVKISGGTLVKPVFVTRVRDVIVISTREDLVDAVDHFVTGRGENSFGLSAQYANHLAELDDLEGDELNVYVDHRALLQAKREPGTWPNPHDEDLAQAVAGRVIQLGLIREAMATVAFGNGLTLDVSGAFSSEFMTPFQKRFYRERGFERDDVLEVARMVPEDAGLFVYGQGPLNDVLNEVVDAMDPTFLELIEDPVRTVWGYADLSPLIGDISAAFGDRVGFFLRDYDYPEDTSPDAPLHDDAVVPAWAVIFTVDSQDAIEGLRTQVGRSPSTFGIRGRDASKGGVFTNAVAGGGVVYEYHTIAIPGTGHLATLEMPGRGGVRYFLVSNSHRLLGQVFVTYNREERPLATQNWFQTLVNTGLASSDLVFWLNPRAVTDTTHAIATKNAELDVALHIDWDTHRPRIEREVLSQHFPGERYGAVSARNREAYELRVSEAVDAFEREFVARELPSLQRAYSRPYDATELTSATLLQLSLDTKGFRMYGRVVVPFDGGGVGGARGAP